MTAEGVGLRLEHFMHLSMHTAVLSASTQLQPYFFTYGDLALYSMFCFIIESCSQRLPLGMQ